ncbi:hypothetical protein HPB50_029468 [Hyalomma asiaticum]|nr:hypothetical protein HPB50_029468 [Hyalomma asiaticum]
MTACEQAKEKDLSAVLLLNQITNFRRKKPTWTEDVVRHCVILRHLSTKKFSSDPIESLFGTLRRSLGCNDQMDARSAVSGLQNLLKTGIAAAPENSNVLRSEEAGQNNGAVVARQQTPTISTKLPEEAVHVLERLKRTNVPTSLPTLQLSAVVYVGGYIARVDLEHMDCDDCCAVTTKALSNQPLQQFVRHQDRGGVLYPSDKLL